MKKAFVVFCLIISLMLAAACTVQQDLVLNSDGSGQFTLDLQLNRLFLNYYRDLQGAAPGSKIFDIAEIRAELNSRPGLLVSSVSETEPGHLVVEAEFDQLSSIFSSEGNEVADIFAYDQGEGIGTMVIQLDRQSVPVFLALSSAGQSPMIDYLLPPADDMLPDEYIDYLAWAMEEYEEDVPAKDVIARAAISLRVQYPGELITQQGGLLDGNAVVFRVPVVDLLLAAEPMIYRLHFRLPQGPVQTPGGD